MYKQPEVPIETMVKMMSGVYLYSDMGVTGYFTATKV